KIEKLSEPTNSTKADGLGLGLQIVRSIIENHGGKIFFSRAASGGLRVEIRLPAEETTEQ
ncbi:ATP-binding protein, partial [Parasutterella sp.]